MKQRLLVFILALFTLGLNAQNVYTASPQLKSYPIHPGSSSLTPHGGGSGNGSTYWNTAPTFAEFNVCGMNYVYGSVMTQTRTKADGYNTNGSGFPATISISGLPTSCSVILAAYLYYDASYTEAAAPTTTATITNPSSVAGTYTTTIIGTGPEKCWAETGTASYRANVTSAISGNGNYTINLTGFANASGEVDGCTLFIIYQAGPTTGTTGTLFFFDGATVANTYSWASSGPVTGGVTTVEQEDSVYGIDPCNASTVASCFFMLGDQTDNPAAYTVNTETANASHSGLATTATFPNNQWNFNVIPTTATSGQNSVSFYSYRNDNPAGSASDPMDCYNFEMYGMYYQNTGCTDCLPIITAPTTGAGTLTEVTCNADDDGDASITVSGGTSPYTYLWNTGAISTGISNVSAGTYTVTVEDAICNTAQVTIVITQPTTIIGTTSGTAELCNGNSTGTATVNATGGTAPYTYTWSNGKTTATTTGLTAGTYTITVKDKHGCSETATVTVTQPTAIGVTTSPTDPLCNGGTGTATANVTGGTSPYTYAWTATGGSGATGTGLTVGNYTVTVKDNNGCSQTATVSITQPTLIGVTTSPTDPLCNGGTGTASTTVTGGTPPYTYAWTATGGSNATGTGLTVGNYTVTVHDNHDCSQTATVSITQPTLIGVTTSPTDPLCNGGTGTATANVTGGTSPYTYAWTATGGSGATGTGLTVGNYTVTVYDNHDCSQTATVSVTQPTLIGVTTSPTDPLCNGGAGTASTTVTGGTAPYTYAWTATGGSGATGTGLTVGNYTVTVKDNNGCSQTATVNITQPTLIGVTTSPTDPLCNGGTGTATATVTGGTAPYTYAWTATGGSGATGTGLTVGNYTVTVKDNNGCSQTATVSITQPTLIGVTTSPTDPLCNGGTGTASTTVTGGTAPYTYAWTATGGSGATGNGLTVGNYTITVHDNHGCTGTATVSITQPTPIGVTTSPTDPLCNGGTGTASTTVTGGTAPYTYAWTAIGGSGATGTGLTVGNYTVTVHDNNGCSQTATVSITQPTPIGVTTSPTDPLCNGGAGTASTTVTGGTAPYTYAWTAIGGSGATGTGLTVGNYTVTVHDNNGCSQTATVSITQPTLIGVTTSPTDPLCNGGTGTASTTVTGGTAPYTYAWTATGGSGATGTGLIVGNYTVTVKDNNGCSQTATVSITQPTAIGVTTTPTSPLCNGGTGTASTTVTGGTAPYTYLWTATGGSGATGTGLTVGNYTVTVHDNHDCSQTATVTISQPTQIVVNTTSTLASCGANDGSATATVSGGTGAYTYSWSPSGGTNAEATGLSASSYTVTVTDKNTCSTTSVIAVTSTGGITVTMGASTSVSCNGGDNGTATVNVTGGTLPYTYAWTAAGQTTQTATGLSVGTYSVAVKDVNGCAGNAIVTITQPTALATNISFTEASCNLANGSATVTVSGGTNPYTYLWTPSAQTTTTASNITAGTYTIKVTDNNGCTTSTTVTVTQPTAVGVTISGSTGISCNGGDNGSATTNVTGGTLPYTYAWTATGGNGATGTGLTAGGYTITVTDNHGCTSSATVTITQPNALGTTTSSTAASCGTNNGTATVTVTGGILPYTYVWNPSAQTTATASNIGVGTYSVVVTDNNNCTTSTTVTVTQAASISATISGSTNVSCNGGDNGSASSTATGGIMPYTYTWTPSGGNAANASGLTAGNYTITIKDANGCVSQANVTITQPPLLVATMGTPTNPQCNGGTGSATVAVGGGTAPYFYAWLPSGGNAATGVGLSAGVYTVTVSDANTCTATATVTITQPALLTATMGAPTNPQCNGGTGSASVTVTGGTLPYVYAWTPSGGNSASASGLTIGAYTVTVTDANTCTSTATVTITQPAPIATSTSSTQASCNLNNGSATVTALGGTMPYTYAWTPSGQNTATVTNVSAGTYSVVVTDNNGCSTSTTVTVTQPSTVTATMGAPTYPQCNGGTGSTSVTVTGGSLPYTYTWTPSGGNTASATLTAGTYTITVNDNSGCTSTATVTITQPALLTASMDAPTNPLCNGGSGSATVTVTGGTLPYIYAWTPSGGNNANASLTAGMYTVTITDANTCTSSATVTITQPNALATSTSATQASCNLNNGNASVSVSGGTNPYTYAWTPSGQNTATATNVSAGTYSVVVTDNNGCTTSATVTVTQAPTVTATISGSTNVSCNGGNNGTATTNVTGGSLPYTYLWTPSGQNTATATGLSANTYIVSVSDANSCTSTASVTITQSPILTATMGVPTNVLCNGGNNGSATVTPGGGTPNYTYAWLPAGGNAATVNGLSADTYTVTVTDANGCTASNTVTITQPALLTATMGAVIDPLCNGGTGSATVIAGGGTGSYNYSWTPSGGNAAAGTGLTVGNYTVTVTDANGCNATANATITQPASIATSTSSTQASCNLANGSASVSATGGTLPYTYAWNHLTQTTATVTGIGVGGYTVTVIDNNGCSTSNTVTVTQPSTVTVTITGSTEVTCNGNNNGAITTNVTGGTLPYNYLWTPSGQTTENATGLSADTYTISVNDANGCISTASVTITQPTTLTATIGVPTNVLCNGGNNGSATVIAGGGTPNYTYAWLPAGGNAANANGLSADTYTVTITDFNGCTASATVTITQPANALAVTANSVGILCNGESDGQTIAAASGGTAPYYYVWTPGLNTNANAGGQSAGSYTITVTDAHGCSATAATVVTEPVALSTALTSTDVKCFGDNDGSINSNTIGGTSPYVYTWSNGQTDPNITGLTGGVYSVLIKDANGCTVTASITITEPEQLTAAISGPMIDCAGVLMNMSATVAGGTLPYTYTWSPSGGNDATASVSPLVTTTYSLSITDANGCTASAILMVNVDPPLSVTISGDTMVCPGATVIVTATASGGDGIYNYLWVPSNSTSQTILFNPEHDTTVTVEVTDGCGSAMVTATLPIYAEPVPTPEFTADVLSGCTPLCVVFRDLGTIGKHNKEITQWDWSFGDGDSALSQTPVYCYKDTGKFSVSLTEVSAQGCSATLKVVNLITVYPPPIANFTYAPQPVYIMSPQVQFTNQSTGMYPISEWFWNFGDQDSTSSAINPVHTYSDTGNFCATLTVMDIHGCVDSVTNCLVVNPQFTFYIPDAFSPNGDGMDDVFMPKGTYVKDYEMYIYDRWGNKLFYTNELSYGWNGTVNGGSTISQEDVYVYLIKVTDSEGTPHSYLGKVTLIK